MSINFLTIPPKKLYKSITSASSSFQLNNIKSWKTNIFGNKVNLASTDFGTQAFCCFRNDTGTVIEIMEIDPATIASTNITILKRGLNFNGDLTTENSLYKLDWSANETTVQMGTDLPQLYQYLKEYIDNAIISGAADASETVKGLVEEATDAEVTAGTATGATGAKLFITPAKLLTNLNLSTFLTQIPIPPMLATGITSLGLSVNTTMFVGLVVVPFRITANFISFRCNTNTINGTFRVALFSENGQTRLFSVTTATVVGANQYVQTALSAVVIRPGNYYIAILPVSPTDILVQTYSDLISPAYGNPSGRPVISGTITVTADTIPTTITPSSITYVASRTLMFRLDN